MTGHRRGAEAEAVVAMTGVRSIRGEQCRAGRRVVGWSLEALAYTSGVSRDAIGHFERGERATKPETVAAITGALEAEVVLTLGGASSGGAGVLLPLDREL